MMAILAQLLTFPSAPPFFFLNGNFQNKICVMVGREKLNEKARAYRPGLEINRPPAGLPRRDQLPFSVAAPDCFQPEMPGAKCFTFV